MAKLTLDQVRNQLYKAVVPNLSSQENIDKFNLTLNLACERIINSGSWLGQFEHVAFLIPEGDHHITLPMEYASVEALSYELRGENGCIGRMPVQIRNEWLTVLGSGPFLWRWDLWGQFGFSSFNSFANDRGDGFVTFRDSPYVEYTLRIEIDDAEDAGQTLLVKGYDADGNRIFTPQSSSSYEGIEFDLTYPSTEPSQHFTKQLYFLYRERFQGYMRIYAVDVDTSAETLIGTYQPNDTNPSYKRYTVPNCNRDSSQDFYVRAICKRQYVPVLHDQDYVVPSNLGALRTALTAIVYEGQNDPGRRDTEMAQAIDLLNNELRSFRGGAAMTLRINASTWNMAGLYPGR